MVRFPSTGAEAARWLLILVGLAILAIVAVYAVNVIVSIAITAALLIVAGLIVWIVGGRLWDWARHGKPLLRGDWKSVEGDE